MNKKIIISVLAALITVFVVALVILLIRKSNTPSPNLITIQPSTSYSMSITTEGNVIIGSMVAQNGAIIQLDENGILKYAIAGFNSPRDVFLVECLSGYHILNPISPTGNRIVADQVLTSANMELSDNQKNTINFMCQKN
jgi:hypothetical protein